MQAPGRSNDRARAEPGAFFPWLLALLVFASRLPYLRPGYGTDPDAYRVIAAARVIRQGEYTASRLPGYPLHEAVTALLLPGGPRLVNGATALVSALAALGLLRLAETLGLDRLRASWLALAFAFTPVVYQNSIASIDYVWSICFVLWSAHQLCQGRAWLAGLLLGAAIGARLTAGGMLLPLLVLNAGQAEPSQRVRRGLQLCLGTALSGAFWFAPVLSTYGLDFFRYDDSRVTRLETLLTRATLEVWGGLGSYAFFGVLAIAILARKSLWARLRSRALRPLVLSASAALFVFTLAYVLLPHEPAYLIPCVPFVLLVVAFLLPALAIAELAILLVLSCFVALDAEGLSLMGPLPTEYALRREENAAVLRVIRRVSEQPGKALIIAGPILPHIEAKLGGSEQGPHRYLYMLQSDAELAHYLQQGYTLYYVDPGVALRQRRAFGIDLREHGARSLL